MPFFVNIQADGGTIEGDAGTAGFEDQINGLTFMTTAARAVNMKPDESVDNLGVIRHQPITFTKHVDKASPQLWEKLTSKTDADRALDSVTFTFTNAGGTEREYEVKLFDARIVQMTAEVDDDDHRGHRIIESLSMAFKRIEWKHEASSNQAGFELSRKA